MWASAPFSFLLSPVRSAQAAARPSIGPSSAARNFAELRASRGTSEFLLARSTTRSMDTVEWYFYLE